MSAQCKERAAPGELFPPAKRKLASIFPEATLSSRGLRNYEKAGLQAFTEWMLVELEEVPGHNIVWPFCVSDLVTV